MKNYLYLFGGVLALITAIIFYYPAFLYIFLFLLYSVILVAIGNFLNETFYELFV